MANTSINRARTPVYVAAQSTAAVSAKRHRAVRAVASIRSSVGASTVNSSRRKPANSDPVDLSSTRSRTPPTTQDPVPVTVTAAVRTSGPRRTQVWSCSPGPTRARSQANSSISTLAAWTGAMSRTKCPAKASP
ncbi:Uncharacterised protein [Mycobacteroides abscessus subsp. abscessus]|nr:Uncharacterised protein [Mycobacteroides abscessus subsp. abscessus]